MKTKKTAYLAISALIISGALLILGCEDPTPEPPPDITFEVTVNTPSGGNSDRLDISFSSAVTGLTKDMITITVGSGKIASGSNLEVTKENLTGSDRLWQLSITIGDGFADTYSCTVKITKTGVTPSTSSVSITKNTGQADFILGATEVKDNKSELTIKFSKDVSLSAGDITVKEGDNDVSKGTLSGSQREYKLEITGVSIGTKISVAINKDGVNTASKSIELGDKPVEPEPEQPGPSLPTNTIDIITDTAVPYSKIHPDFVVENGYPRKYTVWVTPLQASKDVEWSILDTSLATVDKDGWVTPKPNVKGETIITAKAKDSSGKGNHTTIVVTGRVLPTQMKISSAGNLDTGYNGGFVDTSTWSRDVGLILGDTDLVITVGLYNNSLLTNDQSVVLSSTASKFTLSSTYTETEPPVGEVPRTQFKLTPGAAESAKEQIVLQSNYAPKTVSAVLNTSVGYKSVTYTMEYYQADDKTKIVASPLDFNSAGGNDDIIYVKVIPDWPIISVPILNANSSLSIQHIPQKDPKGKFQYYKVTRNKSYFGPAIGGTSTTTMNFSITDMKSFTTTLPISVQYSGSKP